ncbi:sodium:proton antiporter [Lachnoclostridium sp. Marseille-P6806]|uniref:sodium:proton antiporter n=1 Tax=Lachnoclostridium sp. Marseille-P6806 TaxID=2364793 RepID=UPI00102F4D1A|nr:sodium:proton antiporter [Lachnoclostridium sp. Marseille-P6806]
MILINYIAAFALIALGFYCMAVKKNLIKICIGMGIADYGANLLIVSVGFHDGGTAPIFTIGELTRASFFVDPVPQALTLTSIVIGACTTAMTLSLIIRLKEKYGTLNSDEIRRLRG